MAQEYDTPRRMGKGFVYGVAAGLALGVILGWMLFQGPDAPPRESVRVVYVPAEEAEGAAGEEEEREPAPPDPPPVPDRSPEARVAPGELLRKLDAARAARDGEAFRALLHQLGESGTPEAQARLVALMGDPSLGFPGDPLGTEFLGWLAKSSVPGIAAAARTRIDREVALNPDSPAAVRGWLALVAQHGSLADLDWVAAQGEREALEAFVHAGARPEVAARVEALFRVRKRAWFPGLMRRFATVNPAAGTRLLEEALAAPRSGEERDLARVYGDLVPPGDVARARSVLLGLGKPIAAVYALDRMHARGIDISSMESLLLAPVEALERAVETPGSIDLYEARFAIERNRIVWSERAARALEAAAAVAPASERASLAAAARRVRAGLGEVEGEWIR
jgi:hypothetical protein